MYSLLMLTKFYPYGTGEAFIENEIEVIAKHFNKIIIIACEVPSDETNVRTVPSNVIAFKVPSKDKKVQSVIDCIGGIGKIFKSNDELNFERTMNLTVMQKIFLGYFEKKSSRIFESIEKSGYIDGLINEKFVLYSYWLFVTARVGIKIKKLFPNNVVYSFCRAHRYDLYANHNLLNYLPYRKLFLKEFDNVYPCSNDGSEYLKKLYPQYANKVKTAYLGTHDKGLTLGSEDGIFRILSCSRLEDVKRVDRIVTALSILDNARLNIEWTHIGAGKNFNKINTLVAKKIKNIKVNLTGNMTNQDVLAYYGTHAVDLFVNVSSSEGLPVSIMEAMSFSIPIIATDVGGTSEIVSNGETGELLPSDFEDEQLAKLIRQMVENKDSEKYKIVRKRTREVWEEKFEAVRNYENLFKTLKVINR